MLRVFGGRDAYKSTKMITFLNVALGHKVILSAKIVKQDVLGFVNAISKIEGHFVISGKVFTVKMEFDAKFRGDV